MPRLEGAVRALIVLGVGLLSGCAVVPGISPGDPSNDWYGQEDGEQDNVPPIQPITPSLIEAQASGQAAAAEAPVEQQADEYTYRVGPGDVLSVIVWEHPELTNPFGGTSSNVEDLGRTVRQDGTFFFPYVGDIQVDGMTPQQIEARISDGLASYVQNPQVNVDVVEYRSKQIYITGRVSEPGVQPITDEPLTVLDALSAAGGFPSGGEGQEAAADRRQAILTRDGESKPIDLLALYSQGKGNRVLRDGDILHVPDNSDNKVFVMGEVNRQSSVQMPDGELSLAEAIAESEGIDLTTADTRGVYVIRGVPAEGKDGKSGRIVPKIYQLDVSQMSSLMLADNFEMQPRDVLYVSSTGWVRWNRVLNQVVPTLSAAFQIQVLSQ